MFSLQKSLCVLNVSCNYIEDVAELSVLGKMTQFYASNNSISGMYDLSCAVRAWPSLSKLELNGNPCCTRKKYRDKIILMSRRLGRLICIFDYYINLFSCQYLFFLSTCTSLSKIVLLCRWLCSYHLFSSEMLQPRVHWYIFASNPLFCCTRNQRKHLKLYQIQPHMHFTKIHTLLELPFIFQFQSIVIHIKVIVFFRSLI